MPKIFLQQNIGKLRFPVITLFKRNFKMQIILVFGKIGRQKKYNYDKNTTVMRLVTATIRQTVILL